MAEGILIDYIATLLKSKGDDAHISHAATVLSDAAALAHLLDARKTESHAVHIAELCNKAKSLSSSKNPSQKVAGLRALTVFASRGGRSTFLASFVDWAAEAFTTVKFWETHSEEVISASWALLTAIFHRTGKLLHIPGVRRDTAPLATKLVAAILQSAEKGHPHTSKGLPTLSAALFAIPASLKQHAKAIEAVLSNTMLSAAATSSPTTSATSTAIACLSALPRAAGDAEGWSAAAQSLIVTSHLLLDTLYLGLEPGGLVNSCRHSFDPAASPLSAFSSSPSIEAAKPGTGLVSYTLAFSHLDAVVQCLQAQLSSTFPVPVPIPISCVLLLATRILSVDADSLAARSTASTGKLAELCVHLPMLHCRALHLLQTLIATAGMHLTPHALSLARLLSNQLGKVSVDPSESAFVQVASPVKITLYETTAVLVRSGGVAVVRHLIPALLQTASVELYGTTEAAQRSGVGKPRDVQLQHSRKKAKRAQHGSDESSMYGQYRGGGGGGGDNAGATSEYDALKSQAAFLGVVEVVVATGSALLTTAQRSRLDDIAAHAATTATDAALQLTRSADGDAAQVVPLQRAAYKALLSSVVAPAGYRPPHLALALALFRKGVRHQCPSIASFSSHALLCCEALLHPRSFPLRQSTSSPAAASEGENAILGMPRFWSVINADAWQAVQMRAAGRHDSAEGDAPMTVNIDGTTVEAVAGFLAAPPALRQAEKLKSGDVGEKKKKKSKQKRKERSLNAEDDEEEIVVTIPHDNGKQKIAPFGQQQQQQQKSSSAVAVAVVEEKASAVARAPHPPPRAATTAVAAQGNTNDDDDDDDESLPDIDSGASSSEDDDE